MPASVVVVVVVLVLLLTGVDPNLKVVVGVSGAEPCFFESNSEVDVVGAALLDVIDPLSVLPANK